MTSVVSTSDQVARSNISKVRATGMVVRTVMSRIYTFNQSITSVVSTSDQVARCNTSNVRGTTSRQATCMVVGTMVPMGTGVVVGLSVAWLTVRAVGLTGWVTVVDVRGWLRWAHVRRHVICQLVGHTAWRLLLLFLKMLVEEEAPRSGWHFWWSFFVCFNWVLYISVDLCLGFVEQLS